MLEIVPKTCRAEYIRKSSVHVLNMLTRWMCFVESCTALKNMKRNALFTTLRIACFGSCKPVSSIIFESLNRGVRVDLK